MYVFTRPLNLTNTDALYAVNAFYHIDKRLVLMPPPPRFLSFSSRFLSFPSKVIEHYCIVQCAFKQFHVIIFPCAQ